MYINVINPLRDEQETSMDFGCHPYFLNAHSTVQKPGNDMGVTSILFLCVCVFVFESHVYV